MSGSESNSNNQIPGYTEIVELGPDYRTWANDLLEVEWGGPLIVTRGCVHDTTVAAGFVALDGQEPVGLVTYRVEGAKCELLTLNSLKTSLGIGTALVTAVKETAVSVGCQRLWLVTTNDNMNALSFYQKRGFSLAALHRGALEISRQLKPAIPLLGINDIPLRDELELECMLGPGK